MNRSELYANIKRKGSFLCVGLDSDPSLFPAHIAALEEPIFEFNKAIIDATVNYTVRPKVLPDGPSSKRVLHISGKRILQYS